MTFLLPTRLQVLFWEIKNRLFYILISFFFSFVISYQNSTSLLYLFFLSYKIRNSCVFFESSFCSSLCNLYGDGDGERIPSLQAICKYYPNLNDLSDTSLSSLLYFYKVLKDIDIASISFIFTDVEEAFSSTILICWLFCLIAILPILFYEILCFFIPSLHIHEKQKWIFRFTSITLMWYVFIYNVLYVLIPKLADFLLKFQISSWGFSITGLPKINSYCTWSITIFIGSSCLFFAFWLLFFCIINRKVEIAYFTKRRNTSRAVILLLSALVVPPEVQWILALIALFCFELAIFFFIFYINRCKK